MLAACRCSPKGSDTSSPPRGAVVPSLACTRRALDSLAYRLLGGRKVNYAELPFPGHKKMEVK